MRLLIFLGFIYPSWNVGNDDHSHPLVSPMEWKDFPPISLCNVSYKVISKVLQQRFSLLLPKMVSLNKTGFSRKEYFGKDSPCTRDGALLRQ